MNTTTAERLRWLIEIAHDGSVNAAAKVMGVPQRTLAAAVREEVKNPGTRLLRRVVEHHRSLGVTMDWLVEGRGPAPKPPQVPEAWRWANAAAAGAVKWADLVVELELPEAAHEKLLALPEQVAEAANNWGLIPPSDDGPVYFFAAQTMAFQTWITLFEGWVREVGAAKVRETLRRRGLEPGDAANIIPPPKKRPARRK
jgi:hypothetical protein